jgi:Tfp pilus assembly protein PilE
LVRTLGIDLTRVEGVAAFSLDIANPSFKAAAILRIPGQSGPLKLQAAGDAGGTPLYRLDAAVVAAQLKSGLVIGSEAEVRAAVAVDRGREPALPKDAGLGKLLGANANDVDFIAAVGPGALPPDKTMGVEDAVAFYQNSTRSFELVLHGDPARLGTLKGMAQGFIQMGLSQLQTEKDKATATNDPLKGATAITTYYQAKKMARDLDPKLENNALFVRYTLPEQSVAGPMTYVSLAGIMAAIAVPSFSKYTQKSKSAEAKVELSRLATSLRMVINDGGKGVQQLKTTDWAPAKGCCGQADNTCAPDPTAWKSGTWQALQFSVDSKSHYQYRVRVEGKGKQVKYTLEARGDLDCDQTFSSYRRSFGADGSEIGEIVVENELE